MLSRIFAGLCRNCLQIINHVMQLFIFMHELAYELFENCVICFNFVSNLSLREGVDDNL